MFFIAFTTIIILSGILFELFYNKKQKDFAKTVSGPPRLPFLGNALQVAGSGADFYKKIIEYYEAYGSRFRLMIGSDLMFWMASAEDIEVVLSSSALIEKSDLYKFFYRWLGTGLLTSNGPKWRKRRKMITPAFHFKIVESFVPIFDKNSDLLIKKMSFYQDKASVDIYPLINLYALDVISETAMGVSVKAQEQNSSEYVKSVKSISAIILMRLKSAFCRFDSYFYFTKESKVHEKAIDVLHSYTDKMINERRILWENNQINLDVDSYDDYVGEKKKLAFLDLLLQSTVDGEKLDHESIREEVDTFLFEGHDTTSSGIAFALYAVAGHADVQNKLYEEQKQIFGDDLLRRATYADLQNMKYLDMVIKEAQRIYPSVPLVGRKMVKDTQINDMLLPAGTTATINILCLHRDSKVFPDPLQFRPERFTPEECANRNPYAYVPFSAGPRNCIGQRFAMLEMKSVISKILRNFKLISVDHHLELVVDLILTSETGIRIKLVKR